MTLSASLPHPGPQVLPALHILFLSPLSVFPYPTCPSTPAPHPPGSEYPPRPVVLLLPPLEFSEFFSQGLQGLSTLSLGSAPEP